MAEKVGEVEKRPISLDTEPRSSLYDYVRISLISPRNPEDQSGPIYLQVIPTTPDVGGGANFQSALQDSSTEEVVTPAGTPAATPSSTPAATPSATPGTTPPATPPATPKETVEGRRANTGPKR